MTAKKSSPPPVPREIERVQTGVRLEKRLTLEKIAQLRRVYGFDLVAADSHPLREGDGSG